MYHKFYALFLGLFLCTSQVSASQGQLELAAQAYDKGDFYQSVKIYEELISEGLDNGHVFYNLGNAYYRLEEPGKAMAAYLAAKRLLPRNPDIKANLAYVHGQIKDKLEYQTESGFLNVIAFWQDSVTSKEIFEVFLFFWCLGFLLLGVFYWKRQLVLLKRSGLGMLGVAVITFSAFLISQNQDAVWGAVSANSAAVRSGPGELNTQVFELHRGAPIKITEEEKDWFLINLSDGKKGWIAKKQVSSYGFKNS
ncbi:MAG: SH3 domain-containing protein [Oligoflexales bacterium]|nr:SH3 domain-containing protein [Oligoflexales bacterium]